MLEEKISQKKPSRAGRKGDSQEMPIPNDLPDIQRLVIRDIEARRALGIERYGTPLQPFNGRDALQDLYEELMDGVMYVRQEIEERTANSSEFSGDIEKLIDAARRLEVQWYFDDSYDRDWNHNHIEIVHEIFEIINRINNVPNQSEIRTRLGKIRSRSVRSEHPKKNA